MLLDIIKISPQPTLLSLFSTIHIFQDGGMYGRSGAKEDYNIMFDPSTMDTCHLHTLARDTRDTRGGHVVPNYSHQLPHSATMGHSLVTPHSYRLVRQHSNDGEHN